MIFLVSLEQAVDKDGSQFEGWCGEGGGGRRGQVGQYLLDKSDFFFLSDSVGGCLSYCGPVQLFLFHVSFRLEADKESFRSQLDAAARKRKVEMEDELNVKKKKILEDELNAKKKNVVSGGTS